MLTIDLDQFELPAAGPGISVSFPMHSASGTASTATVLFELEPGAELPIHTDSAEELLIVLEGSAEATVGEEVGRLEKHQAALVPAMAPHGVRNVGDGPLRVFGTFSSSTIIATFEEPLDPAGTQVVVMGAPFPMRSPLVEPVAA